jgi:drug/metabolite transporter (DMT)-like permease
MTESSKGTIYALLAVAMFATLGTGFKVAVTRMDSYSVVVWMGIWATSALFLFLLWEGRVRSIAAEFLQRPLFFPLTGTIGLGVQQILCLRTYELIPASQAVILHYTYPLMMLLLSRLLFREKTGWGALCCVVLGFVGVCVLVVSGGGLGDVRISTGVAVALATAFSFALFCVLIIHGRHVSLQSVRPGVSPLPVAVLSHTMGSSLHGHAPAGLPRGLPHGRGLYPLEQGLAHDSHRAFVKLRPDGADPFTGLHLIAAEGAYRPDAGSRYGDRPDFRISQRPSGQAFLTSIDPTLPQLTTAT